MLTFGYYRDKFARLYEAVKAAHEQSATGHSGHGLDHDVSVAMMAVLIAIESGMGKSQTDQTAMAFVAGLIHSTDTVVGKDKEVRQLDFLLGHLPNGFTSGQVAEIAEAVLRHTEFKDRNVETRKLTQRILMDADKLVNLNPLHIIRAGQHYPSIPAIELQFIGTRNPASTHHQPTSIIEDLYDSLEWIEPGWFHLPNAQRRAEKMSRQHRAFITEAEEMFHELGLAGIKL